MREAELIFFAGKTLASGFLVVVRRSRLFLRICRTAGGGGEDEFHGCGIAGSRMAVGDRIGLSRNRG
jgi:hypothetical protein